MKKVNKKPWGKPAIKSELSIKGTLGIAGTMGLDGGGGKLRYTS